MTISKNLIAFVATFASATTLHVKAAEEPLKEIVKNQDYSSKPLIAASNLNKDFSIIFIGDTQFGYNVCQNTDVDPRVFEDCIFYQDGEYKQTDDILIMSNEKLREAAKAIIAESGKHVAMFHVGDMTMEGKTADVANHETIWIDEYDLNVPLFLSTGNHDIHGIYNLCMESFIASLETEYIRSLDGRRTDKYKSDNGVVTRDSVGSWAYSVEAGIYTILHVGWPLDKDQEGGIVKKNTVFDTRDMAAASNFDGMVVENYIFTDIKPWLTKELDAASTRNQPVILSVHSAQQWRKFLENEANKDLREKINNSTAFAFISGHIHGWVGYRYDIDVGRKIPVLYTSSPHHSKFLNLDLKGDGSGFDYQVMDYTEGRAIPCDATKSILCQDLGKLGSKKTKGTVPTSLKSSVPPGLKLQLASDPNVWTYKSSTKTLRRVHANLVTKNQPEVKGGGLHYKGYSIYGPNDCELDLIAVDHWANGPNRGIVLRLKDQHATTTSVRKCLKAGNTFRVAKSSGPESASYTEGVCKDFGWTDNNGNECDWYERNDSTLCPNHGHNKGERIDTMFISLDTAKDACCFCGGGFGITSKKGSAEKRRRLELTLDSKSVEELFKSCKNESYALLGYVEGEGRNTHVDLVAKPFGPSREECNVALVFDDYDTGEKMISFVEQLGFDDDWAENTFHFGKFELGAIKAAVDSASVVTPEEYDIMTNNCATFGMEVLGHLKVPITKEVIRYIVKRLAENPAFVKVIRANSQAGNMLARDAESLEELTDKEVLWCYASKYAKDHKQDIEDDHEE